MRFLGALAAVAFTFASTRGAEAATTTLPFELANDHVFIDVALDGTGPYHFVVDSGSPFALLDASVARELHLPVAPQGTVGGVGNAQVPAGSTTARVLRIGGLAIAHEPFVVTDLHGTIGTAEGRAVDGVIGRDLLKKFTTTFDYEHRTLAFDPDLHATDPADTTFVPMRTARGVPQIDCTIAGVRSTCNVDTGSRLPVTVLAPFTHAHPRVVPSALGDVGVDGFGLGGAAFGRLGILPSLEFGGYALRDVICDYSTQTQGAFADENLGGNIGGGVLKRFTVIFEYARQRIGFSPNAGFALPPLVDRSGLFLVTTGDAIQILDVRPATPASRAGLAKNDRILDVDGEPVSANDLPTLRARLSAAPGTSLALRIERDGTPREIAFALEDYVGPGI